MSSIGAIFNTAKATYWKAHAPDEYHKVSFDPPIIIMCDYGGDMSGRRTQNGAQGVGTEIVIKETIWTEFSTAKKGDYIMIGESTELDPTGVDGADEIVHVIRYADTFDRQADDYAIMTGE
ncbi:hypothetical protein I2492_15530 [Budviciaceae bacterium CWB-B4]|uniref:Uncharacterized protein n=1 Tax=Limnobaculum xujianqingii TaxID=2738837 RepID=A0A9D7AKX6_9GAMM|nr:hypothetical protein [Limnobaculum xujianqingii]MBK5074602.1 hypothetical protein [Limnobaculum xujianqingii]MBK5177732.1 hypothetical protein [Limnobaculum xujianqingii]